MIPKIIHYCWLSDDPIPDKYQAYISGWKEIMPHYEFKKWDRTIFNLDNHKFAKKAYENKKYAYAADLIRVYALYHYGGIYLDSDVEVFDSFDKFLSFGYFTSIENHWNKSDFKLLKNRYFDEKGNRFETVDKVLNVGLQAAIFGSEKHHPLTKDLLDYYMSLEWIDNELPMTAPYIHSRIAEKYGFRYLDEVQFLKEKIAIFPSNVFATNKFKSSTDSQAIHHCAASWVKTDSKLLGLLKKQDWLMTLYLKYKIITKK